MTSTAHRPSGALSVGSEFAELWAALASQYAVERELGRGGMGAVFLARDVRLDRFVAIKVLPPHLAAESDLRELFLREARTAARLSHPNIVPVFRADELAGHPFFAMPFIEGDNLAERVSLQGPQLPADAVRWLREVAWALAYAHARGVIHRDVKPENIMIERGSNRAIVTDFGIARVEFGPVLAQDALIVGTASYMSPEQIRGEGLDGRSDLYSLGVVGFVLLTGKLPFNAASVSALLDAHTREPAPPIASVVPSVPAPIASVIDRCLAKEREGRFPTGESLADALEKALRLSESALGRTGEYAIAALSSGDASLVWQRAIALQIAELSDSGNSIGDQKTMIAARELEAAAVAAGIQSRFVRRALDELIAAGNTRK
ncbi:MAG TPA: serine/threonine-protein kinase [Gemmatimonadaceae bacterium]|jgi:serine/threonine-protein kinase